jgi:hypothetical protein
MSGGDKKLFKVGLIKQLKSNYSLMPIVFIGAFGVCLSAFQITRTLTRSPDVVINRSSNPKPYEKMLHEDGKFVQYKYFTTLDYKNMHEHPDKPKY